jgi:FdhD protein
VTSEPAAPPYSTRDVDALRLPSGSREREIVAVEEPLEIRIGGEPVAVTMRTPGHDEELALGFCLTEGIDPRSVRPPDDLAANTVEVEADGFDPERLRRHFYTSSSCGVCGKGAIEAVQVDAPHVESELTVTADVVSSLPERLRTAQQVFAATGGLHATGLFAPEGQLLCVREDVGRHNAMDKVVGWAFGEDLLPLSAHVLCVSGRLSFELVQKAAVAGCPVLVAVGAPSSLAVELASDRGVTLCGWVREGRLTVYTEPWRIALLGRGLPRPRRASCSSAGRRSGSDRPRRLRGSAASRWPSGDGGRFGRSVPRSSQSARPTTRASFRSSSSTTGRTSELPCSASSPASMRRRTRRASSCPSIARS